MTTQAQIDANRRNAQKSTGPKTDQGKAESRRNALKHGLSGLGIVLPAEEGAAFDQRRAEWNSSLRPFNALDVWFADEVVRATLQIERCHVHEQILRTQLANRASRDDQWAADRRISVEIRALSLPKKPALVIRQLEDSLQGADWIIERWNALALILDQKGDWTEKQRSLALDLLGVAPELRDGPTRLDPLSGDTKAHRQWVIAEELARLKEMQATSLETLNETERAMAEVGLEMEIPRSLSLLRRYEASG